MRKLLSLVLAMAILCGVSLALADPIRIDGTSERNITINDTGLNKDPQALIDEDGISPTTGRYLDDIEWKEGWDAGVAPTKEGTYRPIMVQISNAGNGVGISSSGKLYGTAPINASYADIVYEAPQKKGGSETRMSMIFSDVIPDYVGFVRSTRLTHVYLRQEWDCAFCMIMGLVLVPAVSLISKAPAKAEIDRIFSCYERKVTVTVKDSIETDE